ncbi:MAG: GNAT family N-acetyltransferase [Phycisphaeraceae bacterium]
MTPIITQPTVADFDELIAFMDRAFNFTPDIGFHRRLPVLYQRTERHLACQHIIRRDGNTGPIVASIGLYPLTWHVGDTPLRIAGIGGVSCDPDHRGRGFMSHILTHLRQLIADEKYHLSYLSGQRQRYAHFGWEVAGCLLNFHLNTTNLKHTPDVPDSENHGFELELFTGQPDDLVAICRLHDAQPAFIERSAESFPLAIKSWFASTYLLRGERNNVAAYAVVSRDGSTVTEIVAADAAHAMRLLRLLLTDRPAATPAITAINVQLGGEQHELARTLDAVAETYNVCPSGNWQIFDWPVVLGALLSLRHRVAPLAPGRVALRINDIDRVIRLEANDSAVHAGWTDTPADVSLDAKTAMRVLFGPLPPSVVASLPPSASLLNAWCPLPLSFPAPDHV